ncbi:Armadillo repeat-containing protein 8 [Gaertneriomyces sp. JEL0708]|nr:Armadillo repeat-containing protein 8 [Gaertneriomyces sp. JEL0708]
MAFTKHEAAVAALGSPHSEERLRAIRFIKNSIIGNKTKKELYSRLGISERLVGLLQDPQCEVEMRIEVVVVVGSFAYGSNQNVALLVQAGAMPQLLTTICSGDMRLIEAGARALRSVLQSPAAPRTEIFQGTYIQHLTQLLSPGAPNAQVKSLARVRIAEVSAGILALVACDHQEQMYIAQSGAIPKFVDLLDPQWSSYPKVQEAALEALGHLCRDNSAVAALVVATKAQDNPDHSVALILRLVRDRRPTIRLSGAKCLTNLYRTRSLPPEFQHEAVLTLIPVLIKLFSDVVPIATTADASVAMLQEQAPKVLADLVEPSEELQKSAMEADAINKLAKLITSMSAEPDDENKPRIPTKLGKRSLASQKSRVLDRSCGHADRVKESALRAIAAICSFQEDCRKQVIEAKLLPFIVAAMDHPNKHMRAVACECTRSLSRSVKHLRTSLVDAGIPVPLIKLLSDESDEVKVTACAALCNIVMDFSPMKKTVLEKGGLERLIEMANSMDDKLRLNAVWALKNLLYHADSGVKAKVMAQLGWTGLLRLLDDEDAGIQEQALNLLRNLACGKEEDIDMVVEGFGEQQLLDNLERKLLTPSQNHDVVLQALYVIVNVATGRDQHKTAIMDRLPIVQSILNYMSHSKPQVRAATAWCVINLTWTDDAGCQERLARLRNMGFESKLQQLLEDENTDVKEHARTALQHFGHGESGSSGDASGGGIVPMEISGSAAGSASGSNSETQGTSTSVGGRLRRAITRDRDRDRDRERGGDSGGGGGGVTFGILHASRRTRD